MGRAKGKSLTGLCLAAILAVAATSAVRAQNPVPVVRGLQRSVSSSRQFVIYYADRTTRAQLARKVEDIKNEWLKALDLSDDWKYPIVVQIVTMPRANAPRLVTNLYEGDGGEMKVQVDIYDLSVLAAADFDIEILRALCLEYAQRAAPSKAGKAFPQPPAWLPEGLYENAMAGKGEGIAAALYDKLVDGGAPLRLQPFLKENPATMDATSRAIYRARSMALLAALLALPDGARNLTEYLGSLSGVNPTDEDKLLEKFPALASRPADLTKLWALALASASATDRVKPLSLDETSKQLSAIMNLSASDPRKPETPPVRGPQALPMIARSDTGKFILREKTEDLMRLEARAHPFLRPVVEEYRLIATQLAIKPKKNLEKRLTQNIELQQAVTQRGAEIEDYMNWFEAAKLDTSSREFDRLSGADKSPGIPERTDAISRHLENLKARGW